MLTQDHTDNSSLFLCHIKSLAIFIHPTPSLEIVVLLLELLQF